ncbi:MAG: hypothetical protein ACTSUU_06890 [Candidatus Thorarchaeota archaeon]
MPNIFGANIDREIANALGPLVFSLTLTKSEPSTRTDVTDGRTNVETSYIGRGFIDDYRDSRIDGTIILTGDRVVTILGASISIVPEPEDTVNIEGQNWKIIKVARDPAGATYECQVR